MAMLPGDNSRPTSKRNVGRRLTPHPVRPSATLSHELSMSDIFRVAALCPVALAEEYGLLKEARVIL
jgi:hypothetical protein